MTKRAASSTNGLKPLLSRQRQVPVRLAVEITRHVLGAAAYAQHLVRRQPVLPVPDARLAVALQLMHHLLRGLARVLRRRMLFDRSPDLLTPGEPETVVDRAEPLDRLQRQVFVAFKDPFGMHLLILPDDVVEDA